jgi:hypothetical protein
MQMKMTERKLIGLIDAGYGQGHRDKTRRSAWAANRHRAYADRRKKSDRYL